MSFWKKVDAELKYKNISRKELASKANFAVSGISLGISHDSIPSADVAVKIAKVLDVPVEYLVDDDEISEKELSPQITHLISSVKSLTPDNIETLQIIADRMKN